MRHLEFLARMWQNRGLGRTLFIVEIPFISVVYFVHVRIPYTKYSLTVTDLINVLNFKYTYVFNAKRIKRLHGSPIKFEPIFDLLFYPFHCQDHLKVKVQTLCNQNHVPVKISVCQGQANSHQFKGFFV